MTEQEAKKYNAAPYPIGSSGTAVNNYMFSPMSNGVKYFMENFGKDLIKNCSNSGIFFYTAAAQKMQESGFGTARLARDYNNFGGIKYGAGLTGSTGANPRGYAIFASPNDCFNTYINHVLKDPTKKYNIGNKLLSAKTPVEQIMVIAESGYCANPPGAAAYAKPIIKLIELLATMYPNCAKII